MYLRNTSMPLFPMVCGTFLDIKSALELIQSCVSCASHKHYLFFYADVHIPVSGENMEGRDAWQAYLQSGHQITQRVAVAFLDHGPFCNPQIRPPSMHAGVDEITNNRLMTFSPWPTQLLEKSHPLWGFRGDTIVADRTGIFPLKWLTHALQERRMGHVPPTNEDYARADYNSIIFALMRTLYGKCVRHCQWLLHDCNGGFCVLPPFHKGGLHLRTLQITRRLQSQPEYLQARRKYPPRRVRGHSAMQRKVQEKVSTNLRQGGKHQHRLFPPMPPRRR